LLKKKKRRRRGKELSIVGRGVLVDIILYSSSGPCTKTAETATG